MERTDVVCEDCKAPIGQRCDPQCIGRSDDVDDDPGKAARDATMAERSRIVTLMRKAADALIEAAPDLHDRSDSVVDSLGISTCGHALRWFASQIERGAVESFTTKDVVAGCVNDASEV